MRILALIFSIFMSVSVSAQDAFDPFIDYSEFETASEEEADINFFRNGRFLTLAVPLSYSSFTSSMSQILDSGTAVGFNLSYFFDLRFAFQIGIMNSDHAYHDEDGGTGSLSMNNTLVSMKYFFNMQNVTKGLSNWNPYIIGGVTQSYRRLSRVGSSGTYAQDSGTGFHIGGGIEVPIMGNKMYLAGETKYTLISYPDENTALSDSNPSTFPGDLFDASIIVGINF
ncbi:MAG: hypothetical protein CL674_05380 [Bdellovibrionaceae bacterium]|nr:hypothetical protein [Pseudobdellovibrionaceae bacterium]